MESELNKLTTDELETMLFDISLDRVQRENALEILKHQWFQNGLRMAYISSLGTSYE